MSTLPRRITRLLIRLVLLLVFVAIPASILYLGLVGLPNPFTEQVAKALSGPEYEVRIEKVRLNLLRGLVALGIKVTDRDRVSLLEIDRLAVALNLTDLIQHRFRVESLELDHANLRIPAGDGVAIAVEKVSARVLLPPGQIRIPRASGILEGFQLELEAGLLNPLAFDPSSLAGGDAGTTSKMSRKILEILREIRHVNQLPRVSLQVSGDLSDVQSIAVDTFEIDLGKTTWREIEISSLRASGGYRNGLFTVEGLILRSGGATLHIAGSYADRTGAAEILVRGAIHPLPWVRSLGYGQKIEDLQLSLPVKLDLHAKKSPGRNFARDWKVLGSVDLENAQFRTVPVDFFGFDFAWQPGLFLSREARIESAGGSGILDLRLQNRIASLRVSGSFDPTFLLPWLEDGMRRVVSQMEFADPARASIQLEIPLEDSAALEGNGTLELGRTALRGAWIQGGTADLRLANRAVEYHNIDLRMDGGRGSGVFVYDFGRREVRLRDIVASVPPAKILLWVDPRIADAVAPYRWKVPPNTRCSGTVDMASPENTRLDVEVNAPRGLDYKLLGKELSFTNVKGSVQVRGRSLDVNVPQATLFGGDVTLRTEVSLDRTNPVYSLQTTLRGVDFASINQLYFNYEGSDGRLSADFSYTAEFSRQTQLEGKGWVRIEDGNVFAIPVLGPLSVLLDSIIPGAGYQTSRLATADFTVGNEIIRTKNMEIVGTGFSLYGEGDIHFMADDLDMTVRLNAQGAPGLVLLPVSKLFEYVGTGSIGNPRWRPKNIPTEVTGAGLIQTVTNPVRQLLGEPSRLLLPPNDNSSEASEPGPGPGPARLPRKSR